MINIRFAIYYKYLQNIPSAGWLLNNTMDWLKYNNKRFYVDFRTKRISFENIELQYHGNYIVLRKIYTKRKNFMKNAIFLPKNFPKDRLINTKLGFKVFVVGCNFFWFRHNQCQECELIETVRKSEINAIIKLMKLI